MLDDLIAQVMILVMTPISGLNWHKQKYQVSGTIHNFLPVTTKEEQFKQVELSQAGTYDAEKK